MIEHMETARDTANAASKAAFRASSDITCMMPEIAAGRYRESVAEVVSVSKSLADAARLANDACEQFNRVYFAVRQAMTREDRTPAQDAQAMEPAEPA